MFRWILAVIIFIAILVWVELDLGWMRVLSSWQQVSLLSLASLTGLTLVSYLLRAYRIYYYFSAPASSFLTYLRIHLLHNALNNFLPMRLGEASFPLLMKRYLKVSYIDSSSKLILLRVLDLHWLLLCLLIVASVQLSALFMIAVLAWFLLPAAFINFHQYFEKQLPRKPRLYWRRIRQLMPRSISRLIRLYAITALVWTLKLLALTVVLLSFLSVSFTQGFFAVVMADLSSVLPVHGLAGSGTFEAAIIAAITAFISYSNQVLLAAVNVHLYLLMVTLLSVPVALILPIKKSQ